jgi:hypothetical protein
MPLRVCCYEDRPEAMPSLVFMGESLCRADSNVSLHITIPDAPDFVVRWATTQPRVILSTRKPDGWSGWDVKPSLLLQELDAGAPEVLWLDDDMIVTRAISPILREFAPDVFLLAEEWHHRMIVPAAPHWGLPYERPLQVVNNCFIRVTQSHRPVVNRWIELLRDPHYRQAQTAPLEGRPTHLLGDAWPLMALLQSDEFSHVPVDWIRAGRHIAQCAGSSGYRPVNRLLDLFRGLPPLIHGIGRKPWGPVAAASPVQRFLLNLATDLSPYVLTSKKIADDLDVHADWLKPRTAAGSWLRQATGSHPGLAGLPLAMLHSTHMLIGRATGFGRRGAGT